MRPRLLLCMLSLALGACALKPPAEPVAPATPPPPPVVAAEPAPPDAVAPLLGYHQSLRRMGQAELVKELNSLNSQHKSVTQAMLSAMVLIQLRGGDLARAQGLLENVLGANEPEAQAVAPLARLLAAYCADLRRGAEHVDRLAAQVKEGQRRNEQLNDIVEGLKNIERTLPARPAAAQPAAGAVK